MAPLYPFFRKFIVYTLSISLVSQPLVAAEAALNHISINQIQNIQHQKDHPRQYALVLTPELWTLQDQQSVVLVDNQIPLGVIYQNQENLFFQAITSGGDQLIKPAHFHFFPDLSGAVTHGPLNFLSEGCLSLYQGEYGGSTKVQAKNIYLKKGKEASQPATVKGGLLLKGSKRVQNTSPLSIKGHFLACAPTFHNKNQIKSKGKGRIQTKKGENKGPIQFSQDSVITGYGENEPFGNFINHNLIASKTKLTLYGLNFKQDRKGSCFAGLSLHGSIDTLQFQGNFWAPLLCLNAQKMLFQGGLLQAYALYLKTQRWLGKDNPNLKARNGVYIQAQTMQGNGNFEIGGKVSAFPYEHFYEDASPTGKRAHKLQKATEQYFRTHSQEIPCLEGCHLNCTILDLDQKSTFNVLSGPCTYRGSYGLVRGQINMGPFNQQLMSFINERDLSIPGTLTGFQAEIRSHGADLSGDCKVSNLKLQTEKAILSGVFEGETLSSLGKFFQIAPTGSVSYNQTILNHDQITIDGIFKGQDLDTHGQSFTVSKSGSVTAGHTNLGHQRTVIAGQLSTGTMGIAGNSVEVSGTLDAGQVTNNAPLWIVGGKADMGNFTSATPSLSLSGHNFKIRNAMIESLDIYFKDIGIDTLTLKGHSLCLTEKVMGQNWNLNLSHQFKHSDLTLSSLYLTTPTWSQNPGSKMTVGQATVQSGTAHLPGTNRIDNFIFQGDNLQLLGSTSGNHWTLNLAQQFCHGDLNLSCLNLTVPTWSQNSGSKMNLGQATVQTYYTYLPGNNVIGTFNFQGDSLILSEPTKGHNWNLSLTHQFSHGDLSLASLSLKAPYWTQSAGTTLQVNDAKVKIGTAYLQGTTKGTSLQGFIDHLNLRGGIESSQVHLQGNHFNNSGWIHNVGGIGLNYHTYILGNLRTQGTLALNLNDRHIDEYLLKHFENTLGYKMLSLQTDQHLMFTESLELHRSLALSAPSISFESKLIQETRKISKGFFRSSMPIWCTPIQNFIVHGDLMLESRNHPLSLSNFNLMAHKGTFLSGSDFILTDSTIQTQQKLLFDVRENMVLNRTNRPSLLGAGNGGIQGTIGGKLIVNASDLFSGGAMNILARRGFEFNAQEIIHEERYTKRTHWGLGKKTNTRTWNEVYSPTVKALGEVRLISPEGGAHFDSTKITSPENINVATKGLVTNQERITYDDTVTKKNTPWSRKRTETKIQGNSPTVVVSMEGINITSWEDEINLPSTVIIAPEVLLEAENDVVLTVPTLRSEYFYESRGLTFSHALSDMTAPLRTLMNLDTVSGSLMSLYDARSQHPVNQISAGMMAGINGYNAYKGYQNALANKGDLKSFMTSRLLSSLCTVQIGYHNEEVSAYETSPGQGGIFSQKAVIRSRKGNIHTLNGVPLDVEKLILSCPNGTWFQQGFKREFGGSSDSFSMGIGFNLLTMTPTDVSMSASSSDYEGVQWISQLIRDPNPTIEAKSVVNLNGEDSFSQSQSGFGFRASANSFSANINGYGFSIAAAPGEGMLGSFGIQAKGLNCVLPLSGEISQEAQPQPAPLSPATAALLDQDQDYVQITKTNPPLKAQNEPTEVMNKSIHKKSSQQRHAQEEKEETKKQESRVSTYLSLPDTVLLAPDYSWTFRGDYQSNAGEPKVGYAESAWSGIKNSVIQIAKETVDLGKETLSLLKDTVVLYAAGADEAQKREYGLYDSEGQYNPTIKDSQNYHEAVQNMEQRGKTLKSWAYTTKDWLVIFGTALHKSGVSEVAPWLDDQQTPFEKTTTFQEAFYRVTQPMKENSHIYLNMTGPQWTGLYAGMLTRCVLPSGLIKGTQFALSPSKTFTQLKTFVSSSMPTFNLAKSTESIGFTRALLWEDFGIKKSPLHFDRESPGFLNRGFKLPADGYELCGSVSLIDKGLDKVLRVHVASIEAPLKGKSPRLKGLTPLNGPEMIQSLKQLGQISGANKLIIRATVVNPRLQQILETRYKGERWLDQTVLEFSIQKGKANPNILLLPAPKMACDFSITSDKVTPLQSKMEQRNFIRPMKNPDFAKRRLDEISYSSIRPLKDDIGLRLGLPLALSSDTRNMVAALSGISTVGIGLWAKQEIDHHFLQNNNFIEFNTLFKKQNEKGSRHFSEPHLKGKRSFTSSFHPDPDDGDDDRDIGKDKKKEKKKFKEARNKNDEEERYVNLKEFNQKIDGDIPAWQNSRTGWYIERDLTRHGGKKYWKLKNPSGKRVLSLDPKGRVIGG